ncbi:GMC oxidoreductase [Terriglobus sp.]|uniref:GMC oxidoreductase n=1 Tax=Terriglobus sp. TaxID=1889013 RepID=UPI003AFF8E8C
MREMRDTVIRVAVLSVVMVTAVGCRSKTAAGAGFGGQQPAALAASTTDAGLHAVHDALFASFLPVHDLPNEPQTEALLASARDGIWKQGSAASAMRALLQPFTDLRTFGAACKLQEVDGGNDAVSYADLSPGQQQAVLLRLQNCPAAEPRRLAATVRNFYIVRGYGAVQGPLTGVQLDLFAPPAYLQAHTPRLAPSRLVYDPASKEVKESDGHDIDVLIVGSGPAGSVLAHELRRGGKRVVLLERGSFVIPGAMETRLIDDLIDTRASSDGTIRVRNGMGVGGGTTVNVDLCFAPTSTPIRTKIEGWRSEGRIAPAQLTQAELSREYDWVKHTVGTRTLTESEINRNNRVLWDGARQSGMHPKLYALNTYAPGKSPSPVTDKRSAESGLLLNALEDKVNPLALVPDADVRRVLFHNDNGQQQAIGVEVQSRTSIQEQGIIADPANLKLSAGQTYTVHAKTVILSAGALGSPTVLLRSGVRNDQIGRGIVLHPSMPIMGRFDETIDLMKGTEASVYVDDKLVDRHYAMESMADQPLYAALMSPGPARHSLEMIRDFRNLAGFGVMLVDTPQPNNRVVLDKEGNPQIDYTLSEDDKKRFAEGVAEAIRVMFRAGATKVYLPTTEDILGQQSGGPAAEVQRGMPAAVSSEVLTSPDQAALVEKNLRFISNRSVVTSAHMQATDKMGTAPQNSVVGQDFHVWGTEHLYVVDGSIFPTSAGANPMQTIYTVAKIFADHWNGGRELPPAAR